MPSIYPDNPMLARFQAERQRYREERDRIRTKTGEDIRAQRRLISVCMLCFRQVDKQGNVIGPKIPNGPGLSHGLCRACAPIYCRDYLGLTAAQTAEALTGADPTPPPAHVRD